MPSKLITVILFIILMVVLVVVFHPQNSSLVSPILPVLRSAQTLPTVTPTPTLIPPVEPQTYQYDHSTDLKAELNKVNPQVLDSDF